MNVLPSTSPVVLVNPERIVDWTVFDFEMSEMGVNE